MFSSDGAREKFGFTDVSQIGDKFYMSLRHFCGVLEASVNGR